MDARRKRAPNVADCDYLNEPFLDPHPPESQIVEAVKQMIYHPSRKPATAPALPPRRPARHRLSLSGDPMGAAEWASRGFDEYERLAWTTAGVRTATEAQQCVKHRITRALLDSRVDGRTVAARIRDGEPVAAVAALLRGAGVRLAG